MNHLCATSARRTAFVGAMIVSVVAFSACGGDDETDTEGAATPVVSASPSAVVSVSPSEAVIASPSANETDAAATDVEALVDELETCFAEEGIETQTELPADLPIWGEQAVISLTFDYGALTVPDAVTIYVFDSEQAAADAKREIDEDLLEGDTETLLRGSVVVDDFGSTLEEPEAAEQAAVVESCTA